MIVPYLLDKPLGATPLQALQLFRKTAGLAEDFKLSYAGRLDPMATGLLIALHGDLLKRQEDFWRLKKTYSAAIVLGIGTDSHDTLGLPGGISRVPKESEITDTLRALVGKVNLAIPSYSSFRIDGRPLFQLAREQAVIPIQVRCMAINEVALTEFKIINLGELAQTAIERCDLVTGDFRQAETKRAWAALVGSPIELPLIRTLIECDSGTYIRSLADELGRRLRSAGLLFELRRTRVGKYGVDDAEVTRLSWPR